LKLEFAIGSVPRLRRYECPPISRTPDPYQQAKNVLQAIFNSKR
jgi:hypothetical protein